MKRKALGTAVVLAALAVLINVFALRSADITNTVNLNIVTTEDAFIGIEAPASPDGDAPLTIVANRAVITLPSAGFQPGSTYVFAPVIKITNNSAALRSFSFAQPVSGVTVTLVDSNGDDIAGGAKVAATSSGEFGLKIVVPKGQGLSTNPTLDFVLNVQ